MTPATDIATIAEAAAYMRVNRKTIYSMMRRKKMPGVRKAGRAIRIHMPTLIAWFEGANK